MFYTYVLKSKKDEKFYIGHTKDINKRLKEHNSGKNISTRHRKPFELVYFEEFDNKNDARWREYKFKKSHDVLLRAIKNNNRP